MWSFSLTSVTRLLLTTTLQSGPDGSVANSLTNGLEGTGRKEGCCNLTSTHWDFINHSGLLPVPIAATATAVTATTTATATATTTTTATATTTTATVTTATTTATATTFMVYKVPVCRCMVTTTLFSLINN